MAFRPMHDRVLVRRMDEDSKNCGRDYHPGFRARKNHHKASLSLSVLVSEPKTVKLHRLM